MKKAILFIACFAVFFISLSAMSDGGSVPAAGYKAPRLELANEGSPMSLGDMRGKYVLLNFWRSSDADSRLKCNQYAALLRADNSISYISVNLDSSAGLFREIVKRDGLDAKTQYHAEKPEADRLLSVYQLEDGMKSFLIAPDGTILAVNPDAALLSRLNS